MVKLKPLSPHNHAPRGPPLLPILAGLVVVFTLAGQGGLHWLLLFPAVFLVAGVYISML